MPDCGLANNPEPPREHKHDPEATYIICDECGCEIWNDTEDVWLEGRFGALCSDCMDKCRRYA